MPQVIQSIFTVAGETFSKKKDAEAFGTVVEQIDSFARAQGYTEDQAKAIVAAYKAGVFVLPKKERKPKA